MSPTLAVSDGMYERHACTDGERQNVALMVCVQASCLQTVNNTRQML